MTDDAYRKMLSECVALNKTAEQDVTESRRLLEAERVGHAAAFALLAIETRLAMVGILVLAALEEEEGAPG